MADTRGYFSLQQDINKAKPDVAQDTGEGVLSDLLPELELKMDDEELINLKRKWEGKWKKYYPLLQKRQEQNEKYWLGIQYQERGEETTEKNLADNLIFESLETFLPLATRQNPEPVVEADNTEEGIALSDKVKKMLSYLADTLSLKLKLKKVLRYWSLYHFGVAKIGWSQINNEITMVVLRPQKLILDPNATIEDGEYTGEYIGEYRRERASLLIQRFPKKKDFILDVVQELKGTELQYIEWWTNDYVFWTLKDEVLGKAKNPHWNYNREEKSVDEFGNETSQNVEGLNHFPIPKKPYVFLSIFNLGKHPHDDVSLIQQNIALQDLINKRLKQVDKNADNTNGGLVLSGDYFTKEQAGAAAEAIRRGSAIWQPSGDVQRGTKREVGPPLPQFVYQSLIDYRTELRNIFGVRGSTPQGTQSEKTVRGKIIVKGQDTDRIGGGISEYLEQFADNVFNWFVQMMYVYYDEPHAASVLGKERAREYITIRSTDLNRKILVTVKEGSLIPKDSMTKRSEAIDLWGLGALDPITLFDRLEFPNPRESAKQLYLWKSNPASLFPDLAQQPMGQPMQEGTMQMPTGQIETPQSPLQQVPI